jgi:uncharacterized membrane protein YeaQ/YmgE (transglycosylase-associated protein family)
MGIAWIVLGLAAGLLASMLIPGKRSQGLIITCVIGIAGRWLTVIAGAAALLLACHLGHRAVRQARALLPSPQHLAVTAGGLCDRVAGFGDAAAAGFAVSCRSLLLCLI